MTWNYRIVCFKDKHCRNGKFYDVKEVYYDKAGDPYVYCDAKIGGETIKECFVVLQMIMTDMCKAYLKYPEHFTGKSPADKKREPKKRRRK